MMTAALLAALSLPDTATEAEALAKIANLQTDLATATNRAESPSLEKFVPRADYDAALVRAANAEQGFATLKEQQVEAAINAAIDQALKDGKVTPATADYHRAQCRQDGGLELFKAYCQAAPVIAGPSGLDGKNPESGKAMNSEEIAVKASEYKEERAKAGTVISFTDAVSHIMKGAQQ